MEVFSVALRVGIRTQVTSVPLTPSYSSISWSSWVAPVASLKMMSWPFELWMRPLVLSCVVVLSQLPERLIRAGKSVRSDVPETWLWRMTISRLWS